MNSNHRLPSSNIPNRRAVSNEPHRRTDDNPVRTPNLNNEIVNMLQAQNDISRTIVSCQQKSALPKKEIQSFDGTDIILYKSSKLNFERTIAEESDNNKDRFIYLQQFTDGKARQIVNSCAYQDPNVAYNNAIELLDKEYADEEIRNDDVASLEKFVLFLMECKSYTENMTSSSLLRSPAEMIKIVMKLPYRLRDSWRRRCHNLRAACGEANFEDLVEFISEELSVLKEPMFGDISGNKTRAALTAKKNENSSRKTLVSNTNNANVSQKYCFYPFYSQRMSYGI